MEEAAEGSAALVTGRRQQRERTSQEIKKFYPVSPSL
jgi:hypothetical protein